MQADGKRDAESQLKVCEAELGLMKEEVARLTQQLHQAQTVSPCDAVVSGKSWDGQTVCG